MLNEDTNSHFVFISQETNFHKQSLKKNEALTIIDSTTADFQKLSQSMPIMIRTACINAQNSSDRDPFGRKKKKEQECDTRTRDVCSYIDVGCTYHIYSIESSF